MSYVSEPTGHTCVIVRGEMDGWIVSVWIYSRSDDWFVCLPIGWLEVWMISAGWFVCYLVCQSVGWSAGLLYPTTHHLSIWPLTNHSKSVLLQAICTSISSIGGSTHTCFRLAVWPRWGCLTYAWKVLIKCGECSIPGGIHVLNWTNTPWIDLGTLSREVTPYLLGSRFTDTTGFSQHPWIKIVDKGLVWGQIMNFFILVWFLLFFLVWAKFFRGACSLPPWFAPIALTLFLGRQFDETL